MKFNRLAQLTTDKAKIAEACSASKLVELDDEKSAVRRSPERKLPVDDELYRANLKARTVFADKFPRDKEDEIEEKGAPATLDEIFDFIEGQGLAAETVAMRKLKTKDKADPNHGKFTGSCFITFCSTNDAKSFIEGDAKFREKTEITKMTKNAYWSLQNARDHAKKTGESVEAALAAVNKKLESEKPKVFADGCVIKFDGVKDATIKREDIKEFLVGADAAVEYIQFESGKGSGMVLLNLEHGKNASEIIPESGTKNIKGDELIFTSGDQAAFDEVHNEFLSFKKRMAARSDFKGKRGRFGNKGGRRDNGGGNRGNRDNKRDNNRKTRTPAGKSTKFNDSGDEGEAAPKANGAAPAAAAEGEPVAKIAKTED